MQELFLSLIINVVLCNAYFDEIVISTLKILTAHLLFL